MPGGSCSRHAELEQLAGLHVQHAVLACLHRHSSQVQLQIRCRRVPCSHMPVHACADKASGQVLVPLPVSALDLIPYTDQHGMCAACGAVACPHKARRLRAGQNRDQERPQGAPPPPSLQLSLQGWALVCALVEGPLPWCICGPACADFVRQQGVALMMCTGLHSRPVHRYAAAKPPCPRKEAHLKKFRAGAVPAWQTSTSKAFNPTDTGSRGGGSTAALSTSATCRTALLNLCKAGPAEPQLGCPSDRDA